MIKFRYLFFTAVVAFAGMGCQPPAANTAGNTNAAVNANSNANTAKPVAAAPSKETLMATEKEAWEAWKTGDSKFFETIQSDRWVSFAGNNREDKAANIKRLVDSKCDVKSYSLSDDQMHMIGPDVVVLSYKAQQDATCAGTKIPGEVWASSAYVREGDKWKGLFYAENAVTDPKAPAPKPAAKPAPAAKTDAEAKADALTEALMAIETKNWEAWKTRDAKGMDAVLSSNFAFVGGSGRYDRAGTLKTWIETKCEDLGYAFSEPKSISLTPDVALVTYKAEIKGSCDGKPNPPAVWVASFNIKEGGDWKNAFYTDVPR